MKRTFLLLAAWFVAFCSMALEVNNLKTQSYTNPVGLDISTPVFSWMLSSTDRNVVQTSYSIVVSTDREFKDVVWESGEIQSDQSTNVQAKGFSVKARTRYYWQVSVTDNKGNTAISTERAYFEIGVKNNITWNRCKWINATRTSLSGQATHTVQDYEVEVKFEIKSLAAGLIFAAKDRNNYYMWQVNTLTGSPRFRPHRWTNGNAACLVENPLGVNVRNNEVHTLRIEVKGAKTAVTYVDGKQVDSRTGDFAYGDFGFREDHDTAPNGDFPEEAYFDDFVVTSGGKVLLEEHFDKGDTHIFSSGAVEGGRYHIKGSGAYCWQSEGSITDGAALFRKTFTAKGDIRSARLYATGLGVYNVYINGTRVGITHDDGTTEQDELKPGFTEYTKTVFYTTHDVTALLREGENAMGAELTSGWWNGAIAHGMYGSKPVAFRGMLIITYADGTEQTIPTDLTWTCNNNGPLRRGDIYNGETYDARLESNWSCPEYDDSAWFKTAISNDFQGTLQAFEGPAVMAVPALARLPKTITIYQGTKANGKTYGAINTIAESTGQNSLTLQAGQTAVIDLGQNAAGWVSFTAQGARGTRLRFRFGEMPNTSGDRSRGDDGPAGSVYTENLRSAEATIVYTLKGDPAGESYHPTSTFMGFRYIEVTATDNVELTNVVGETVTSAMAEQSSFKTSHPDVNQLYSNIMWGQRSNLLSIPTDCPQRDERQGWSADTQVYSMAGLFNADTRMFYEKWMRDMRDSQRSDGAFPHIAPYAWGVGHGAAAWADAGVIVPWNVYLMTGDLQIIKDNWTSMEKYMNWLATKTQDGYKYNGGETTYGDWVAYVNTDSRYCSVCYYAYVAQLMAKMARALSVNPADSYATKAKKYDELFTNIKAEWQSRYTNASTGVPKINTQCAYLMALHYNLLRDEAAINRTVKALASAIANNGYKLNTGFLGTAILNQTLSEFGLNDEAYTLLLQRQDPSWLYSIDQGATTIWERWNSYTVAKGYGPVSMNSFNHYSYGIVAEWMFRYMAGIVPDESNVGFHHFILRPTPDRRRILRQQQKRITSVDADFMSTYGPIKAAWQCDGGEELSYTVTIPANTTATLYLPVSEGKDLFEGGRPVKNVSEIEYLGIQDGVAVCNLGSGTYTFTVADATGVIGMNEPDAGDQTTYTLGGLYLGSAPQNLPRGVYVQGGRKVVR